MQSGLSTHHRFELIILGVLLAAFFADSANIDLLLRTDSDSAGRVVFTSSLDPSTLSPIDDEDSPLVTVVAVPTPSAGMISTVALPQPARIASSTDALHLLNHSFLI
jgi:hypothetical protein